MNEHKIVPRAIKVYKPEILFCPKCKREELIDLKHFQITLLKQSDAKTQN